MGAFPFSLTSSTSRSPLPRDRPVSRSLVVKGPGDGRCLVQGLVRGHTAHGGEENVGVERLESGYDLEAADVELRSERDLAVNN